MRRLLAVTTVVGALVGATSATAGPDPYAQAQRLCERQGTFYYEDTGATYYACQLPTGGTERYLSQARRLCERNGGDFIAPYDYMCDLP